MVKKIFAMFLLLALTLSFANAANVNIKIKTLPDHKVLVSILEPDKVYSLIDSFIKFSDSNGDVSLAYDTSRTKIDVAVKITKDGNNVFYERFEDYDTDKPISIRMDYSEISGNYVPEAEKPQNVTNETEEELNTTVNEQNITGGGPVSGAVISDSSEGVPGYVYFIIIGAVFVLVAGFVIVFMIRRYQVYGGIFKPSNDTSQPATVINMKNISSQQGAGYMVGSKEESERVRVLEARIRDFQKELSSLRNDDKIKAAERKLRMDQEELQKRLKKDQEELDRLRRGEG